MPIYLALLFRAMKRDGSHEGCIEQIYRLFENACTAPTLAVDTEGRNRVDDKELRPAIQSEVETLWSQVTTDNLNAISDFRGFRADFLKLFGFGVTGVNHDAEVDAEGPIRNLIDLRQPSAD